MELASVGQWKTVPKEKTILAIFPGPIGSSKLSEKTSQCCYLYNYPISLPNIDHNRIKTSHDLHTNSIQQTT